MPKQMINLFSLCALLINFIGDFVSLLFPKELITSINCNKDLGGINVTPQGSMYLPLFP